MLQILQALKAWVLFSKKKALLFRIEIVCAGKEESPERKLTEIAQINKYNKLQQMQILNVM